MVYCGYSSSPSVILETKKIVNDKGTPLNGGLLFDDIRVPPTIADILTIGLYAGGGIHLWMGMPTDARLETNLAPAIKLLSDYELFLQSASLHSIDEYANLKGIAKENVIAYQLKDHIFIALTNTTSEELKIEINLKVHFKNMTEYFSKQKYSEQSFNLNILPGQALVLDADILGDH